MLARFGTCMNGRFGDRLSYKFKVQSSKFKTRPSVPSKRPGLMSEHFGHHKFKTREPLVKNSLRSERQKTKGFPIYEIPFAFGFFVNEFLRNAQLL